LQVLCIFLKEKKRKRRNLRVKCEEKACIRIHIEEQCWIRVRFGTIALGGSERRSKTFEQHDGIDVTDSVFSLDGLLMHYASHHHVLEKLMMYESELQAVKYR
jgi:hypothetical protein